MSINNQNRVQNLSKFMNFKSISFTKGVIGDKIKRPSPIGIRNTQGNYSKNNFSLTSISGPMSEKNNDSPKSPRTCNLILDPLISISGPMLEKNNDSAKSPKTCNLISITGSVFEKNIDNLKSPKKCNLISTPRTCNLTPLENLSPCSKFSSDLNSSFINFTPIFNFNPKNIVKEKENESENETTENTDNEAISEGESINKIGKELFNELTKSYSFEKQYKNCSPIKSFSNEDFLNENTQCKIHESNLENELNFIENKRKIKIRNISPNKLIYTNTKNLFFYGNNNYILNKHNYPFLNNMKRSSLIPYIKAINEYGIEENYFILALDRLTGKTIDLGGGLENYDKDFIDTAIRETEEESNGIFDFREESKKNGTKIIGSKNNIIETGITIFTDKSVMTFYEFKLKKNNIDLKKEKVLEKLQKISRVFSKRFLKEIEKKDMDERRIENLYLLYISESNLIKIIDEKNVDLPKDLIMSSYILNRNELTTYTYPTETYNSMYEFIEKINQNQYFSLNNNFLIALRTVFKNKGHLLDSNEYFFEKYKIG